MWKMLLDVSVLSGVQGRRGIIGITNVKGITIKGGLFMAENGPQSTRKSQTAEYRNSKSTQGNNRISASKWLEIGLALV